MMRPGHNETLWGSQSWLQPALRRPLPREDSLTSQKAARKGVPRGDPRAGLPAPQLAACLTIMLVLLLTCCKPWTVRPIGEDTASQPRGLDAPAYVTSIWNSKVLPYVREHAVDLATACQAARQPGPAQFLVKGDARVLPASAAPRPGLLPIDAAPFDGRADAAIQMGPVIRGTALRDALPFIEFSQFLNQLEFARVSNELNARAAAALAPASPAPGQTVSFLGAMARPAPGQLPEIVAIELGLRRRAD